VETPGGGREGTRTTDRDDGDKRSEIGQRKRVSVRRADGKEEEYEGRKRERRSEEKAGA
jgi:hypothetical protein